MRLGGENDESRNEWVGKNVEENDKTNGGGEVRSIFEQRCRIWAGALMSMKTKAGPSGAARDRLIIESSKDLFIHEDRAGLLIWEPGRFLVF